MSRLSLDDFEWVEKGFDRWFLMRKKKDYWIAEIQNFNGWRLYVRHETSKDADRPHLDTLDAAQALACILAAQHLERYQHELQNYRIPDRVERDGPPGFRTGVFKVG
jgi:hypothetical protein